jgi:hypothetical protein
LNSQNYRYQVPVAVAGLIYEDTTNGTGRHLKYHRAAATNNNNKEMAVLTTNVFRSFQRIYMSSRSTTRISASDVPASAGGDTDRKLCVLFFRKRLLFKSMVMIVMVALAFTFPNFLILENFPTFQFYPPLQQPQMLCLGREKYKEWINALFELAPPAPTWKHSFPII